jgi:hypothetical protein
MGKIFLQIIHGALLRSDVIAILALISQDQTSNAGEHRCTLMTYALNRHLSK